MLSTHQASISPFEMSDNIHQAANEQVRTLESFLKTNPSIEFIRVQWVDFSGTLRARLTTVRQALKLAAEEPSSISVASPIASAFLVDGEFHHVEAGAKDNLILDWSTLTVCHYHPTHAAVLCFIDQGAQGNFQCCPRSLLKRVERDAKEKHNLSFLVGVEVEFYLTTSAEATAPVKDTKTYCSTASLRSTCGAVLTDAIQMIEAAGIPTWTSHSELVAGLFEISTEPMPACRLADSYVYMHEAIKTAAHKHGLHATVHPKPFDKTHGVGQHLHISLSSPENDDSFLAGVLDSVPALCAIAMPQYDSYLRIEFPLGDRVTWNTQDRTATVRKMRKGYWEFRFVDGAANIYLTLAAILGVGLAGLASRKELTVKPVSEQGPDAEENKPFPLNLKEAIRAFKVDGNVKEVLGEGLCEQYAAYKTHEEGMLAGLTLQERRAMVMAIF